MDGRHGMQWVLIGFMVVLLVFSGLGCPKPADVPPGPEEVEVVEPEESSTEVEPKYEEVSKEPYVDESAVQKEVADVPINLLNIYFDFDRYNLGQDMRGILKENYSRLQAKLEAEVLIEGHCDERGTVEYNLALGQKRANSARDYLLSLGMKTSKVSTISYGEEMPEISGSSEEAWAKNRRAHFVILKR